MRELGLNNPALFPDVAFAHSGYSLAVGDYDPNSAT